MFGSSPAGPGVCMEYTKLHSYVQFIHRIYILMRVLRSTTMHSVSRNLAWQKVSEKLNGQKATKSPSY